MKILVINYEFPPLGGGAGDVTRALCREYAAKGHEVKIITSQFRGLPRHEALEGCEILRTPALRRHQEKSDVLQMGCYLLGACPRFLHTCRTWRPDVIHAHFLVPTAPLARLGKQLFGIPYIVTLHGGDVPSFVPEQTGSLFKVVKPCATLIGRDAANIVAVSRDLAELARNDFAPIAPKISHIDNGTTIPADLSVSRPGIPTLLAAGRLSVQKNLGFLINALSKVNAPFRLIILGDGPERSHLEDLAVSCGIADKVHFAGWVDRKTVLDHMQNAHYLVMPSLAEGMPVAGLQAYSCGLPVIGTRVPGLQHFVRHGQTGFLVEPHDEEAFTELLERVCRIPEISAQLSTNCLDLVRHDYDWSRLADQYLKLMENCR